MSEPRLLLVGDSHLARLGGDIPQLGSRVTNRAFGGAFSTDLRGQVEGLDLTAYDVVIISVGTNDAAPWKQVPVEDGALALADFVGTLPCPVLLITPPGVDEERLVRTRDRTNRRVTEHSAAFSAVICEAGGVLVDSRTVLASLGARAFLRDGVHLTRAAYALLLPAVAQSVAFRSSAGVRRS